MIVILHTRVILSVFFQYLLCVGELWLVALVLRVPVPVQLWYCQRSTFHTGVKKECRMCDSSWNKGPYRSSHENKPGSTGTRKHYPSKSMRLSPS